MHSPQILCLTRFGKPIHWISVEEAIIYHAKGLVKWSMGDNEVTLRGGVNRASGTRSTASTSSIIAIDGDYSGLVRFNVTRPLLFQRDKCICAFCGHKFFERELSVDHVTPKSRGGKDTWTNLVTSCKRCNHRKADRTPEEANMPLIYVPYEPNANEAFILSNRRILEDQMEYLINCGLSKHSRVLL